MCPALGPSPQQGLDAQPMHRTIPDRGRRPPERIFELLKETMD
jgi:hypothetical protein